MKVSSTSSRQTTQRISRLLFLSILLFSPVVAKDKTPKSYPEHGKIAAVHVGSNSRTLPVYTDPYGKTHGGNSVNRKTHTYRIETDTRHLRINRTRSGCCVYSRERD